MTPDEVALVDEVIARVAAAPDFAACFYERLFAVDDSLRGLFPDLAAQQTKLADELVTLGRLLHDVRALEAEAGDLGDRHRGYGVRAAHYDVARAAMEGALVDTLGDDLTEAHLAAWRRAYNLVTEAMQTRRHPV